MPRRQVILGVNPGTREFGYAIVKHGHYRQGGVVTIKHHKAVEKKKAALSKNLTLIILREQPQLIVWPDLSDSNLHSEGVRALQDALIILAVRNRIPSYKHPASTIRMNCVEQGQTTTRENLCKHLAEVYPELQRHLHAYEPYNNPKWKYWFHLFNAVGAIHTHLEQRKLLQK